MKFQNSSKQKQGTVKTAQGLPIRLIIPKINVDARIEYMGVTATGAMEVPDTAVNVGWFKLGPRPGEHGSAVIAGHFDGKNGEAGVFINLYTLKKGDKIYVEDSKGTSVAFVVRESRIYIPSYANDVFSSSSSAHLNLITCDGVWNGVKKSYSKRLVIFTDLIR
ncbi:MAG: class F sortase [Candidatus Roizmanbacteria bacterium]|nr:class F sortase [Candidatus Roizmanbacteria bacterium]